MIPSEFSDAHHRAICLCDLLQHLGDKVAPDSVSETGKLLLELLDEMEYQHRRIEQ